MASRGRKRRGRKKETRSREGSLLVFAILFGALMVLAFRSYLSGLPSTVSIPPYEEISSSSSQLAGEIRRINRALYDSLYQERIPAKHIFFMGVKPKHEETNDWDFTEVLVKLSKKDSLLHVKRSLKATLGPLGPAVSTRVEKPSEIELIYHIFALGFYTHKITLSLKSAQSMSAGEPPKVAIIIDDLGPDNDIAEGFVRLDIPISMSVLPLTPYSRQIAEQAAKKGYDLLLHLPMEPKGYPEIHPGPGVLLTEMGEDEIRKTLDENLQSVPGVRGVNNHMGSRFTEREDKMAVLLTELKRRGLFYVDSRTTSETVAFDVAKRVGVPAVKRSVFLDNDLSPRAMKFQVERLLGMAKHSGSAVGIGHPHEETLMVLKNFLPKLRTEFRVVPVSDLIG
ncbi:MAG: divergent polysaccharide deacetylase family protein [Proteobacteria bacterium]|nr:divergent polysaccharide deacetylase family protein [Pseudomonadota bacterium]